MIWVFILLVSAYVLVVALSCCGWLKQNHVDTGFDKEIIASLIVPFRDEEKNIPNITHSIKNIQNLNEVIWVNDHSTDNSVALLQNLGFNVIHSSGQGKKQASARGIENASADLIFFTDADCVLQPEHVTHYRAIANKQPVDFAYGPVVYNAPRTGFYSSIFFLDQLALNGVALGLGSLGVHTYCSGANMMGNKAALTNATQVLTQSTNLSGDDVALLHYMVQHKKAIQAVLNRQVVVVTEMPSTLGAFFNQRLRWGQKSAGYKNGLTLFLSVLVFAANSTIVLSLILSLSNVYVFPLLLLVAGKLLIDFLFLFLVANKLGYKKHLLYFVPAWLVNTCYIPVVGIVGLVYKGKWKGRKVRR